jgi:hypothetical protein
MVIAYFKKDYLSIIDRIEKYEVKQIKIPSFLVIAWTFKN